jgi:hypothetical protein
MEVVMSARNAAQALGLLVAVALVGCANEVGPDDVDAADLDVTGDDAFEDEGALVASPECSKDAILARAPNDERLWALAIAHRWIDLGVTYDRGGTFEGYRKDCSGFVSMAWGLARPGPATAALEPFSDNPQTYEIPIDQLLPGDAVNRRTRHALASGGTVGHIRLFGGWIDQAAGTHCVLEYYSTGRVGRAMKGTRADLDGYIGLRRNGLSTTPRQVAPVPDAPPSLTHTPGCGVLAQNESLAPGALKRSCDGRFRLVHQTDGNVVLYTLDDVPLWNSRTNGQATSTLVLQGDGNFVLYGPGNRAAWNTQTQGHSTAALVVQDDGNVVLYGPDWSVLWQTRTGGH